MSVIRRIVLRVVAVSYGISGLTAIAVSLLAAQNSAHSNLQRTYPELKNPYSGQHRAAKAGRKLFVEKCARCHGHKQRVLPVCLRWLAKQHNPSEGVIFSYVTRGYVGNVMPS